MKWIGQHIYDQGALFRGKVRFYRQLVLGEDDSTEFTITRTAHSDEDGGSIEIKAGGGGGTDKEGGNIHLYGGTSTGNASGGHLKFSTTTGDGSSDATANTVREVFDVDANGDITILGDTITNTGSNKDLSLVADGSMMFGIDRDNDETGQSWAWTNYTTTVMELTEAGNLQMDGTLQVDGASITFDSVGVTAIQTSGESFVDNDTSLMTSAAIDDRINAASGGIAFDGSTANGVLTYKDSDEATVEADLTYDSETLTIGADDDGIATIKRSTHSDDEGGDLYIRGGDSTGTDKEGGKLRLYGGRGTSNADGGAVSIYTSKASGSSGTTTHTPSATAVFQASGNTLLYGSLIFEGATPDAHEIFLTPADPGADATITIPAVTGTMAVSGASGSNMIILDSGSHYLNTITADEWYFGNNSFGRNYHYWNNVKAAIGADDSTFTLTEDVNLIGRFVPEALSKVKLQLSARPSGGGSTGEILSVCIVSADRDAAGTQTTWTVLAQGEITQVQGEYDGVDITYTGSIATSKMLAVGVGSSEASSISTTNVRFSYTLTGYLT